VTVEGLVAEPTVIPYELDYANGRVTCPPARYVTAAMDALGRAAIAARKNGFIVEAIGISSQAQTYVALDRTGEPIGDFTVWLDNRAHAEAEQLNTKIANASAQCGFRAFTGQQFLPKVIRALRSGELERSLVRRFVLLNEYLARHLTGTFYGDTTCQGMGGFFDVSRRNWSTEALNLAGVSAIQLVPAFPAAAYSAQITPEIQRELGLPAVPVFLCGNDQCCAAAGVDLPERDGVLCNFGTAMVLYSRKNDLPEAITENQIAGIDPLTSRYFLLGLMGDCGNVIEWLAQRVYPELGIEYMMNRALKSRFYPAPHQFEWFSAAFDKTVQSFEQASIDFRPALLAQMFLEQYRANFAQLLLELRGTGFSPVPLIASGGLSRSPSWLDFLQQSTGIPFIRATNEHPGLLGIARIVARHAQPRQDQPDQTDMQ